MLLNAENLKSPKFYLRLLWKAFFSVLCWLTIATATAKPLEAQVNFGVGSHVGTTGLGGFADLHLSNSLSGTAFLDLATIQATYTGEIANDPNAEIQSDANLSTVGFMGSLHPFNSGFRLSSGITFGNLDLGGTFQYDSNIVTNNDGDVRFELAPERNVFPYLGLGYTSRSKTGLYFRGDIGVLSVGGYDYSANANLNCGVDVVCQVEEALVNQEANQQLEEYAGKLPGFWPVARIGLGFRF